MERIRVFLADDHPVIRAYIRRLLQQAQDVVVIGEADEGLSVLRSVKELEPDIILLDMEMPGCNGVQITREIKRKNLPTRVLVISSHNDRQYILELFRLGIAGYIVKDEVPVSVLPAVRAVAGGQNGWVSSHLAACVSMGIGLDDDALIHRPLSDLDREILQLFTNGKSDEEISTTLGLRKNVISEHLQDLTKDVRCNLSHMVTAVEGIS